MITHSLLPLPELIERLNRHLRGWANYFRYGYSAQVLRQINHYVRYLLVRNLRRRSQRPWSKPQDQSLYAYFQQLGLFTL